MERFNMGLVRAGYVGLVTGACLGHRVTCVDIDEGKVANLGRGRLPVYEPGLQDLVDKSGERLRFTTDLSAATRAAEVLSIAVDTPRGENGSADLSSVAAVARGIGRETVHKLSAEGDGPVRVLEFAYGRVGLEAAGGRHVQETDLG